MLLLLLLLLGSVPMLSLPPVWGSPPKWQCNDSQPPGCGGLVRGVWRPCCLGCGVFGVLLVLCLLGCGGGPGGLCARVWWGCSGGSCAFFGFTVQILTQSLSYCEL